MHRDLVERAMAGDREAFTELTRQSIGRLYAIARLILRDNERAEDATQEALVAAWRQLSALRDADRFDAWLRRLLVRACYREAARDQHQRRIVAQIRPLQAETADPGIALADRDQLDRGFSRLKPEQRALMVLHYYLELPMHETAEDPWSAARHREVPALSHHPADARGHRSRRASATRRRGSLVTAPDGFDRQFTAWLSEQAPMREPDGLLPTVSARIERTRRIHGWAILERWLPMQTTAKFGAIPRTAIILVTLAVLATVLAAVAFGAQRSPVPMLEAYGPARNGDIAYSLNGDIYIADATGANPQPVITGPTQDRFPWFSQGGTKMGFQRGLDPDWTLMVANADGSDHHQITTTFQWFDFMPDDKQIVVGHKVDGHGVVSIFDVDGTLVRDLDIGNLDPEGWVTPRPPDGQELIFTAHPVAGSNDMGLYGIGSDGKGLRLIGDLRKGSFQGPPVISPDGKTMAYWDWEQPDGSSSQDNYIHMRDLTSGAELPVLFTMADHGGLMPRFSPDGTMVVFERRPPGETNQQLFYGPVDGSKPSVPIGPSYYYTTRDGYDFSPDGTKVYLSKGSTSIIDVDSGLTTELKGVADEPGWQRLAP